MGFAGVDTDSPEHGLLVHRPEKRPRLHIQLGQPSHCLSSIEADLAVEDQTIDPVDVFGERGLGRLVPDAERAAQEMSVEAAHFPLPGDELVEPFELRHANRGLEIAHAQVPAKFFVDEPFSGLEAQVAQSAAAFRERVVVGYDHAAFTGRNVFVRIEAECADVAKAAAGFAAIGRAMHFGRVLDDF